MKPLTNQEPSRTGGSTPEVLPQEVWASEATLLEPTFATVEAFGEWLDGDLIALEARLATYCTRNSLRHSLARAR